MGDLTQNTEGVLPTAAETVTKQEASSASSDSNLAPRRKFGENIGQSIADMFKGLAAFWTPVPKAQENNVSQAQKTEQSTAETQAPQQQQPEPVKP